MPPPPGKPAPTPRLIRMELSRILIQELKDYQVIELREVAEVKPDADADPEGTRAGEVSQVEDGRSFPIVIGLPEAQAIERRLKGVQLKRPQTHELLANIIEALGGLLTSVTINDLADATFYAQLNVRVGSKKIDIDCRPSDAIAIGLGAGGGGGVPIYVAEHVLEQARKPEEE